MTLLRRMPRGLYSTHGITAGTSGTPNPFPPDCGNTYFEGYKLSPAVGSIRKSTFRGITINEFSVLVSFTEQFGECWVNTATLGLYLNGTVKLSKLVDLTNGRTYIPTGSLSATSFTWDVKIGSGGTATWYSVPTDFLLYY